ncbi:MAG: M3 family metallopeptidase [Odoribacter sp.]|nr:M3 family metallopeptidase [Odoribacter sp.]
MYKKLLSLAVAGLLAGSSPCIAQETMRVNPFLQDYTTVYEIPPFADITYDDYMPALRAAIDQHNAEIDYICFLSETPTFENTILALEKAGRTLDKVVYVFSALEESNSSPEMVAIAEEFYPLYSQHSDAIAMNKALFKRIKYLYNQRENLGLQPDQIRLIEQYYKNFVRSGALLNSAQKKELTELNTQLTSLYLTFNKNLLNATNAFSIVIDDEARLAGLPANLIATAAEEAAARGLGTGKWVFTLHAPSRLPVLQYASDRDLRRQMYQGYTSLAQSGEYNNLPVISDILQIRAKKAHLLGYKDFGSYMTENVMAKTVDNARNLLMQIWKPAVDRVNQEVLEMQALADAAGDNITIEPWDYYYYAEKVRAHKYNLDENEVRAYFPVDSVRKGIFTLAEKLYGVKFTEMPDAPKYFDEVTVYDVTDTATGEHIATFMTDYFTRPSKRQGAWMSEFKGSWTEDDGTSSRPVIFNVGNFTRPAGDTPSLLTLDEVETMFHEFGHGLHGMLTRARYKSQAGTNVDRDFVELPSQITEHWAMEPELLRVYAHHYITGETIPDDLIARLEAASTHNQGFTTAELCGAALLDLEFGELNPDGPVDVTAFEQQVTEKLGMPAQLTYRYRPTYFKHVFGSDGYASGYYTYLWAEVLDTDGFELFKEKGVFDQATAASFKHNVLEMGGSEDPMTLYIRFRGHEPSVDALLRNRGLK